jgi:hypothetical protein
MAELGAVHRRRLRDVWRSAGWPSRDAVELDLLSAGLLVRHWDAQGHESVRITDAGLDLLADRRRRTQAAYDDHESLVERVSLDMQRSGRLVWRRLSLRAPLVDPVSGDTRWAVTMPDVFSIRNTTLEDGVEPVVQEIKVSRADLLADLRRQAKGAAYRAISSQCWYVVRAGICEVDELPAEYGVWVATENGLELGRPAPRRPMRLPFAVWMALARARAEPFPDDPQGQLGAPASGLDEPPAPVI